MTEKSKLFWRVFLLLPVVSLLAGTSIAQSSVKADMDTSAQRSCLENPACPNQLQAAFQIAERMDFVLLLHLYQQANPDARAVIVQGIFASKRGRHDADVVSLMRSVAFRSRKGERLSDTRWYALQFLAESCDKRALDELRAHGGDEHTPYGYHVACNDWAATLESFGRCHYPMAKEVLLDSLNSSCLDVANAAAGSLDVLYPGVCPQKRPFSKAKSCYFSAWER
jgi:hypothetical protein